MSPFAPCSLTSFMEVAQIVVFHAQVDNLVPMECDRAWPEK